MLVNIHWAAIDIRDAIKEQKMVAMETIQG